MGIGVEESEGEYGSCLLSGFGIGCGNIKPMGRGGHIRVALTVVIAGHPIYLIFLIRCGKRSAGRESPGGRSCPAVVKPV